MELKERLNSLLEASKNLNPSVKRKINNEIYKFTTNKYFNSIPINDLMEICKKQGVIVVDEAGDPWTGIITGSNSRDKFDLMQGDTKLNNVLVLTWYKMQSGRFEIVSYIS